MQDGETAQPHATVVAADEGLRLSLVHLLEICDFDAVAFARVDEAVTDCRLDSRFIFIDCTFGGDAGIAAIEELRRLGWQGTVIFMAEGAEVLDPKLEGDRSHVLVKPFSSDDVIAIIGR